MSLISPSPEKLLWANIIIPFAFFVILSPGSFITFPPHSLKQCTDMIPFPQKYTFVKGDGRGTSESQNITSESLNSPAMSPINDARKKCMSLTGGSITSKTQVILHAIVFTFVCILAKHAIL
jgi:hypothetical protein